MNGFKIIADGYKKAFSEGKISQDETEKKCRIYDFLATCDQEDICNLFNSSAFNDISKSYLGLAVNELTEEGTINKDQAQAVRDRFSEVFDNVQAQEIIK